MEEEIEYINDRPQPKYALITVDEYYTFNHSISIAKGWKLNDNTERSVDMYPRAAKVNIQYDAEGNIISFDKKLILYVDAETQMDYPELIAGFELVDSYIHVDEPVTEFDLTIIDDNTINWMLDHFDKVKGNGESITVNVPQMLFDKLPDIAKEKMADIGLNIKKKD